MGEIFSLDIPFYRIATNTPQSEQSSLFQIFAFATIWHAALAGLVVHFSAEYIGHSFRFIC